MATWWLVESDEKDFPYRSGCFKTRAEARYRLNEMASSDFYGGISITRRADDFFVAQYYDTVTKAIEKTVRYSVVKL